MDDSYGVGAFITGLIAFVWIWIYCSLTYGFLGFALGWMPAMILGWVLGLLWPLVALLLIIAVLVIIYALRHG